MTEFREANAKFAMDFFKLLSQENPFKNIVFSPANLTCALGMLLLGSESDTAAQIENILHLNELRECKAPERRRYLAPSKSYDHSRDKSRPNVVHRTSSTTALYTEDEKHRPNPGEVPCRCPPGYRPKREPICPSEEVPDYECDNPEGIHAIFHNILAELNKLSLDYELDLANRLYADYSIVFLQKFLYCALKLYQTEVDGVDIQNAPEEVRRLINLWVEIQTHGKIKDLFPKKSFDSHADLLLVNALSFKGKWELEFDKEFTQEGVFYLNERDSTTVQFMYQKGEYNIGTVEEHKLQVLEIPYKNRELSLFILLPQDSSVQQLEHELTAEKLLDWASILNPQEVEVVIPKFRVEKSIEVDAYFDLSNVTDPKKADLSGTTTTKNVAVTHFLHDTFIEVDEAGGEKANACDCSKRKQIMNTLHFVADHPFIFFLNNKSTGTLLTLGRFSKPE